MFVLLLHRHCEEPKATRQSRARVIRSGLLRFARNDEVGISQVPPPWGDQRSARASVARRIDSLTLASPRGSTTSARRALRPSGGAVPPSPPFRKLGSPH